MPLRDDRDRHASRSILRDFVQNVAEGLLASVDAPHARTVLREILDRQLEDPRAWVLRQDGVFERLDGSGPTSHEFFMAHASDRD